MARPLKDISGIQLRAKITPFVLTKHEDLFRNYFRTFKSAEEYVEDNHFCSPFFSRGEVVPMNENYGDRINPMRTIMQALKGAECMSVYLTYDFRLAAVNEEYYTDNEFRYVKNLLERALKGTGLYLAFMVSHFGQLAGKPPEEKSEHFHVLICRERKMTETEYMSAVGKFVSNLRENEIIHIMERV